MIYLALKIFVYLVLAMLGGAAAGWLWRNQAAELREDQLQRDMTEARGRIPQLEALMRSRDEQLKRLTEEADATRQEARNHARDVREQEQEITRLKREVEHTREQAERVARNAAVQEASQLEQRSESDQRAQAELQERLESEVRDLEAQLAAALTDTAQAEEAQRSLIEEHDEAQVALEEARRRVVELERERDLQNKSLKVLNQQLSMERERAAAQTAVR